ncbi:glutamyl-tRNA(Gln) amidotransferase subunit C [Candidatus Protochlamydia naegleriophila]|uniref:Aspartyl/glutamyl-tRNA(Asn/Gln) amidotransferase subunit C n=1 Tax=Candidatus Protochlamydia naegleriophila TaxID=389348 RepID=A0A0U5K4V7_9BACT|nr:Asp-tRNA(Asn)/Glu-tRNA(Gln) amidotransferase subunit GatC [Candidatus Protochlamydia naegleriophila]CUI17131.1 glutamyl-tRNA(Gln) amidotransferase subunit C [Candidatus Protochlamydia naegleriophila]
MAELDKETITKLTHLCRIDCTEEEQEALLKDLKNILKYIEQLQQIDTENVLPCNHVLDDITNVMRDDVIGAVLNRDEDFLPNAPSHIGGLIRTPPVIKQS